MTPNSTLARPLTPDELGRLAGHLAAHGHRDLAFGVVSRVVLDVAARLAAEATPGDSQ